MPDPIVHPRLALLALALAGALLGALAAGVRDALACCPHPEESL